MVILASIIQPSNDNLLSMLFQQEESNVGLPGGNGQLLTLGVGLLVTALAATYVTGLAKVNSNLLVVLLSFLWSASSVIFTSRQIGSKHCNTKVLSFDPMHKRNLTWISFTCWCCRML